MTYIIRRACIDIMTPSHPSRRPVGAETRVGRGSERFLQGTLVSALHTPSAICMC